MAERKFRIRYADVAATLALLMATSGTAYAATALPKNSVGSAQIKAEAVTAVKVRPGAVTDTKLAANAVTSGKVLNRGITEADLAEGSVRALQLADGAVTTVKIGAGQITEGHLAPNTVTGAKVADHSLTLADLDSNSVRLDLGGPFTFAPGQCFQTPVNFDVQVGDLVVVGWASAPVDGFTVVAWVSTPGFVMMRECNPTTTPITVPEFASIRLFTIG